MPNYKITLEYEGTNYVGWQRQENGLSIQQLVEEAIEKLSKQKITLFGAGRTDAGVHARGQVANFELEQNFHTDTIRDGINNYLRHQPISKVLLRIVDALPLEFDFLALMILILSFCIVNQAPGLGECALMRFKTSFTDLLKLIFLFSEETLFAYVASLSS